MTKHKWKFLECINDHHARKMNRYECEVCKYTGSFGYIDGKFRRSLAFKHSSYLSNCDFIIMKQIMAL
jgi:hypothetical protein